MSKRVRIHHESDYWLKKQASRWGINLWKLDKYSPNEIQTVQVKNNSQITAVVDTVMITSVSR